VCKTTILDDPAQSLRAREAVGWRTHCGLGVGLAFPGSPVERSRRAFDAVS
jgi:hypothetical protein